MNPANTWDIISYRNRDSIEIGLWTDALVVKKELPTLPEHQYLVGFLLLDL